MDTQRPLNAKERRERKNEYAKARKKLTQHQQAAIKRTPGAAEFFKGETDLPLVFTTSDERQITPTMPEYMDILKQHVNIRRSRSAFSYTQISAGLAWFLTLVMKCYSFGSIQFFILNFVGFVFLTVYLLPRLGLLGGRITDGMFCLHTARIIGTYFEGGQMSNVAGIMESIFMLIIPSVVGCFCAVMFCQVFFYFLLTATPLEQIVDPPMWSNILCATAFAHFGVAIYSVFYSIELLRVW
jgi:hypothetical protein